MLNVILCDDNSEILAAVRKYIEGFILMEDIKDIKVELSTTDPNDVLNLFREKEENFDGSTRYVCKPLKHRLLILDTAFGSNFDYDGVALARCIRKFDDSAHIVFFSSHRHLITDVVNYRIMPLAFLNKPVFSEEPDVLQKEILDILMYAYEKMSRSKVDHKILEFKTGNRKVYVKLSDVFYIQGNEARNLEVDEEKKKALTVLSEAGGRQYFKKSLKYYDEQIPELIKLGKSYLINPMNVVETKSARKHVILKLRNGEEIRVMKESFQIYETLLSQLKDEGII